MQARYIHHLKKSTDQWRKKHDIHTAVDKYGEEASLHEYSDEEDNAVDDEEEDLTQRTTTSTHPASPAPDPPPNKRQNTRSSPTTDVPNQDPPESDNDVSMGGSDDGSLGPTNLKFDGMVEESTLLFYIVSCRASISKWVAKDYDPRLIPHMKIYQQNFKTWSPETSHPPVMEQELTMAKILFRTLLDPVQKEGLLPPDKYPKLTPNSPWLELLPFAIPAFFQYWANQHLDEVLGKHIAETEFTVSPVSEEEHHLGEDNRNRLSQLVTIPLGNRSAPQWNTYYQAICKFPWVYQHDKDMPTILADLYYHQEIIDKDTPQSLISEHLGSQSLGFLQPLLRFLHDKHKQEAESL